jgi:hypothetical protein
MAHLRNDAATASRASASRVALLAVAALLAALAALALRPGGAGAALTPGFMDPAFQTEAPDVFWTDMTTLKAGVLRYDVYWREIAPNRPVNPRDPNAPEYDWSTLDRLVRDANAHGMQVLFTLWRTPAWARADGGRGGFPGMYSFAPNLNDWTDFVVATATRYSGTFDPDADGPLTPLPLVSKWEMWNEPNYIGALRPQRIGNKVVSPKIYTDILNAGYRAIGDVEKAFGVQMDVLGGSMNRGFGGAGSIPALKFLRGMKEARAKFDIASLHPYPITGKAGMNDRSRSPNITLTNYGDYEKELDKLWPAKRYKVWFTEYGAQSTPDRYGASPNGQAAFVKTALKKVIKKHPRVQALVWFLVRDEAVELPGESDNWQSGLRDESGNAKPAYQAWVDTVTTLL